MTKIKNIGSKIIGVGKAILMPDETISVADSVAELPAIKTFAKMGFVAIEKEAAKVAAKEESTDESADTANAAEPTAEKKAPAKKASTKTAE